MAEGTVDCLEDHAAWLAAAGQGAQAVELAAAAVQTRTRRARPRPPRLGPRWQRLQDALRSALGDVACDAAWQRGRRLETEEAVKTALGLGVAVD